MIASQILGRATVLNIAGFVWRSRVNGPGTRAVLWLQGCDQRCPGCYNADILEIRANRIFSIEAVARVILDIEGIEGVTFTGGEPTLQAAPLAALSRRLRENGLSVMCYTGHVYEELVSRCSSDITDLLDAVDLLIDGPYLRTRAPGGIWRGSANQRLIALSERGAAACERSVDVAEDPDATAEHGVEVHVTTGGALWTGVFPPEVIRRVQRTLAPTGWASADRTAPADDGNAKANEGGP